MVGSPKFYVSPKDPCSLSLVLWEGSPLFLSQQNRHPPGWPQRQSQCMACSGQNIAPGKRAKDKEMMLFQLLLHRADLTSRTEQGDMRPGLCSPFCGNPAERLWTSNLSGPQFTSLSSKINTTYSSYQERCWEKKIGGDREALWKTQRKSHGAAGGLGRWDQNCVGSQECVMSGDKPQETVTKGWPKCSCRLTAAVQRQQISEAWAGEAFRRESRVDSLVKFPNLCRLKQHLVAWSYSFKVENLSSRKDHSNSPNFSQDRCFPFITQHHSP